MSAWQARQGKNRAGKRLKEEEETFVDYQEFLEYIRDNITAVILEQEGDSGAGEPCMPVLHKVTKNNGVMLDALTWHREGETITPNIYLNPYYECYQMGQPACAVLEEIYHAYQNAKGKGDFLFPDLSDFEAVKDKIVVRLVNYGRNKEELESCPFKPYQDLAVTFRFLVRKSPAGMATSIVSNDMFRL